MVVRYPPGGHRYAPSMRPDVEMSLGEHLDELRKRVMRALLGVLVAACIAGVFYQEIMTALLAPYLLAWEKLGTVFSWRAGLKL